MKFAIVLSLLNGAAAFVAPKGSVVNTELSMSDYGLRVNERSRFNDVGTSGGAISRRGGDSRQRSDVLDLAEIWDDSMPVIVQGGSLRTWNFANPRINSVQVLLKTEGRPLDCDIELWNGPDNTPNKMRVYVEDGALRTFNAVLGTPRGPNTVAVRNIGQLEFPLDAVVRPDLDDGLAQSIAAVSTKSETIQGGAIRTYPFDASVDSVAIILKTDGRPLNARVELLQGPNNNKQVVELYTEDGLDRPFFAIIETPGSGNVVRILNSAPIEFPLYASVDAYIVRGYDSWNNDGYMVGQWPKI